MSKIIKGIGSAVKKVFEGVKKVFKKIWESPIGKIIIIAAAIYLGGAALGAWNSVFPAVNGSLAGLGQAMGIQGAEYAAAGINMGAAAESVAGTEALIASQEAASLAAAQQGLGGAAAASTAAEAATGVVTPPTTQTAPSMIDSVVSGVKTVSKGLGGWVKANPELAIMGLTGIANATAEDDPALQMDRDLQRRYAANTNMEGIYNPLQLVYGGYAPRSPQSAPPTPQASAPQTVAASAPMRPTVATPGSDALGLIANRLDPQQRQELASLLAERGIG